MIATGEVLRRLRSRRTVGATQPPLVEAEDSQAVEDREGVDERVQDGHRADARAGELVVERDRHLLHPSVPERARDGEQLDVEGVPLDEQERHHLLRDLAAEDLEPDLGVADIEVEEHADELLVQP